jgi:hypothetical protein
VRQQSKPIRSFSPFRRVRALWQNSDVFRALVIGVAVWPLLMALLAAVTVL